MYKKVELQNGFVGMAQDVAKVWKEKDIIKKIEKRDKYRSDYYKYHTGRDWNDARNYDFCLNTSSTSYEKLVKVVKDYISICTR